MNTGTQSKHTSTKTLTTGAKVILIHQGQTIAGGEIVSISGRNITLAETVETYIGGDGVEPELESTELALGEYTISRSLTAWGI